MAKKASTPLGAGNREVTLRQQRPLKARVLALEHQNLEGRLDAFEKRLQDIEMELRERSDDPTVPTTSTMSITPPDEDIDPD